MNWGSLAAIPLIFNGFLFFFFVFPIWGFRFLPLKITFSVFGFGMKMKFPEKK